MGAVEGRKHGYALTRLPELIGNHDCGKQQEAVVAEHTVVMQELLGQRIGTGFDIARKIDDARLLAVGALQGKRAAVQRDGDLPHGPETAQRRPPKGLSLTLKNVMQGIQRPGNAVSHVGLILLELAQALLGLCQLGPQSVALALKHGQTLLRRTVASLRLCFPTL